jgi:tetratricopeptide (TPR) repeat protein
MFYSAATSVVESQEQQKQEEKISSTLEQGIGQYKHENYDEALLTLKKAKEEEPESSLAAYYLGLTYKQLQDYQNAVQPLTDAVTYSPKIKGALIELIDCLYQIGQLEEADKWISEAEREGIRPAQVAFLKGLVLLKEGKAEESVKSFNNAKDLDSTMAQAADYQIATAYLKAGAYKNAKEVFQQLVLVDPNSTMANFANSYMQAITERERMERPFRASAGVYWQYDDNVVLDPSDSNVATNITDKADSREVTTATAEYDYRFNKTFDVKAQYFFYWAKQNNLGFYDTLSHTFVLQPDMTLKDGSLISLPIAYNVTYINDKSYLSTPSIGGVYNRMVGSHNMGQVYLKYAYKDYIWGPSIPDENRTGNDFGGGAGWYFFFMKNKGFLNLRYGLTKEWTEGNNWENWENNVNTTLLVPVMDKLNVTFSGNLSAQYYENSNSVFNVYRRDQVWTLSTLAAYKIYGDSEVQLQYTYVNDDSNIGVYSYTRNIYSVGVEIKF